MAKQKTEAKQRGSANKKEKDEVFEVEAILSHRRVSTASGGHSNVIIERCCSFLWLIQIVSIHIYMCTYHTQGTSAALTRGGVCTCTVASGGRVALVLPPTTTCSIQAP